MTEAAFADYHLYTLKGAATLRDRETQILVDDRAAPDRGGAALRVPRRRPRRAEPGSRS